MVVQMRPPGMVTKEEPGPAVRVEVRCTNPACRRLLLRADPDAGRLEIICPGRRCRRYQVHMLHDRPL